MSYDEQLAARSREIIAATNNKIEEKKMFGGLCFMVNDKMCIGVEKDRLMVRIDPAIYEQVLEEGDCEPMDFTGRPMKGYVFVSMASLQSKSKLERWIGRALEYNKVAKARRPKKRK